MDLLRVRPSHWQWADVGRSCRKVGSQHKRSAMIVLLGTLRACGKRVLIVIGVSFGRAARCEYSR